MKKVNFGASTAEFSIVFLPVNLKSEKVSVHMDFNVLICQRKESQFSKEMESVAVVSPFFNLRISYKTIYMEEKL